MSKLSKEGQDLDITVFELAHGPFQVAQANSKINVNGYHFRTQQGDIGKSTQDCGVAAYFDTWSRSSTKDKNPKIARI